MRDLYKVETKGRGFYYVVATSGQDAIDITSDCFDLEDNHTPDESEITDVTLITKPLYKDRFGRPTMGRSDANLIMGN